MLEEFEKALCDGKDLDAVARTLIEQANEDRQKRIRLIEHDRDFAELILEGLNEPKGSGVYSVCKAYMRMYRNKHSPGGMKLAHLLIKDIEERGENP